MSENQKIGLILVALAGALFWYNRRAAAAGSSGSTGTTGTSGGGDTDEIMTIVIDGDCTQYGTCDGLGDVTK